MTCNNLLPLLFFFFFSLPKPSNQQEILSSFNVSNSPWLPSLKRNLTSPNSTFAAGFRSVPNAPSTYIFAVWYQTDGTVVWSVNGDSPVGPTTPLVVTTSRSLRLNDSTGENLWKVKIFSNYIFVNSLYICFSSRIIWIFTEYNKILWPAFYCYV